MYIFLALDLYAYAGHLKPNFCDLVFNVIGGQYIMISMQWTTFVKVFWPAPVYQKTIDTYSSF